MRLLRALWRCKKQERSKQIKKPKLFSLGFYGAEDEARTRDNQLGRLELYQLSYFRIFGGANINNNFIVLQVFFNKICILFALGFVFRTNLFSFNLLPTSILQKKCLR